MDREEIKPVVKDKKTKNPECLQCVARWAHRDGVVVL